MKNIDLNEYIDELRSLNTENVGSWPTWVYALSCVVVAALIIGLGQYYLIKPKREQFERVKLEEPRLKQTFETKQRKVANLDAYKAQLAEMERTFGAMLRQLPSKSEIANLLFDISQTRVASGLEEELFQPKGEISKEFYAEVPNTLTVVGTYHELADFISKLAILPRIVTVHDVSIDPVKKKKNPDSETNELRMSMTTKTYRYLDEEEFSSAEGQ